MMSALSNSNGRLDKPVTQVFCGCYEALSSEVGWMRRKNEAGLVMCVGARKLKWVVLHILTGLRWPFGCTV